MPELKGLTRRAAGCLYWPASFNEITTADLYNQSSGSQTSTFCGTLDNANFSQVTPVFLFNVNLWHSSVYITLSEVQFDRKYFYNQNVMRHF